MQCACEGSIRDQQKTLGGRTGAAGGGGSKGVFGEVWGAFLGGNGQSYPFAVAFAATRGGEAAFVLQADDREGTVDREGQPADRLGNICSATSAQYRDDEILQGGHHSWGVAGPYL